MQFKIHTEIKHTYVFGKLRAAVNHKLTETEIQN